MGYATFSLLPDFRSRALIMGAPIGIVVVLVGIEILSRRSCEQLASFGLRTITSLAGISFNNFRAIAVENMFAFDARVTRQTKSDAVTQRYAVHREGNAGVSAAGVQN